jgi:hypothetical protein
MLDVACAVMGLAETLGFFLLADRRAGAEAADGGTPAGATD